MKRITIAGLALALAAGSLMAQFKPKSKGEADAYNALIKAAQSGDNNATIKAADDLLTRYADTAVKASALDMEAAAYHHNGDDDHAQVYAEQAIAADPKDYQSPLLLGETIVAHVRENDLDKDEKLAKADKALNMAVENTKAATKPNPALTDEQWEGFKKDQLAECQADLGRLAMARKKWDDAIASLLTATAADPQPAYLTWLASAQLSGGKPQEALATCDKILAIPNLAQPFKTAVSGIRVQALTAKK